MRKIIRLAVAFIAVLAVSALAAGTASAKSQKLVLDSYYWSGVEWEEKLVPPGSTFDLLLYRYSIEGFGPDSFYVETSTGTATCDPGAFPENPYSGLKGKLQSNGEPTDTVEISEPEGILAAGKACSNTSALGSKAHVVVYPQASILSLKGSKGKAELTEKSTSAPIAMSVEYSSGPVCFYTAAKLKGTLKLVNSGYGEGGAWKAVVLTFAKSKVKLVKEASSTLCDKKTTISVSFGIQDNEEGWGFGNGPVIFGKLL
jgi:hypothetical protein